MRLQGTSQARAVEQPGVQNERSPQIKSSPDARQSARVARLEPGVAPGSGQVAPAQKNSTIRHLDPDEIAILLSRGMDLLKSEDFASARVTLQRAAEAGNAEAALALGTTYDPSVLRQLGAVGIAADVAEAREWYEKAVKFGSAAATQRLARLVQPTR
jgi:TPR repeat protein